MATDSRYADRHVGDNPISNWPSSTIDFCWAWGADEISENIEDCRGCSGDHGLCDHHRGQIQGYAAARNDVWRELRHLGVLPSVNEALQNSPRGSNTEQHDRD